jgi:hypothetical protein
VKQSGDNEAPLAEIQAPVPLSRFT